MATTPDSVLPNFVKQLVIGELLVRQADSAGIKPDSGEVQAIRNAFKGLVKNTWAGLRISPELLADSAKTPAEKERLAAARVDGYMDRLLQGQEGFIDVPPPLADALREKYDGSRQGGWPDARHRVGDEDEGGRGFVEGGGSAQERRPDAGYECHQAVGLRTETDESRPYHLG